MASISALNSPANIFQIHTASLHVEHVAMYSSCSILSAILVCFLLNHEIMPDPRLKQHLEVLLISLALNSQSESMNACNMIWPLDAYLRP